MFFSGVLPRSRKVILTQEMTIYIPPKELEMINITLNPLWSYCVLKMEYQISMRKNIMVAIHKQDVYSFAAFLKN